MPRRGRIALPAVASQEPLSCWIRTLPGCLRLLSPSMAPCALCWGQYPPEANESTRLETSVPDAGTRHRLALEILAAQGRHTENRLDLANRFLGLLHVFHQVLQVIVNLLRVAHGHGLVTNQLQDVLDGGALREDDLGILANLLVLLHAL